MELHDTLNQKLFDKNNVLRKDVRASLLNIVDEFMDGVNTEIAIPILDMLLLGSNAGYNYSEDSDIDLHIIVNYRDLSNQEDLVKSLFNTERKLFNSSHNILVKGFPVEVYVEDLNTNTVSNGIYSVMNNRWEKIPTYPHNVNTEEVNVEESEQYSEIKEIAIKLLNEEDVSANDIHDFITSLYLMRKYSIARDGEYGFGNLIFKKLRAEGYLDGLKDRLNILTSKELSLESTEISSNIDEDDIRENVPELEEDYDYKELYGDYDEEDNIPEYLIIEDGILKECTDKDVVNVDIPNSVIEIGEGVFFDCTSLKSVTIPNSVTRIGFSAFWKCKSLQSITIPDSVKEIGYGAFNGCTSLESIIIPNSVTVIGYNVFYNCLNLTIRCNKGSYAEKYAIDFDIKVEYI